MDKPESILIVDDDQKNIRIIEAMLLPVKRYNLIVAASGHEALNKTVEYKPDLILLDAMMPKLNGFEVAQKLKNNKNTKHIPIIMVTALDSTEDRVKAIEAGADDFITKPIEKNILRARISSLLKVKAYHDLLSNYTVQLEKTVTIRNKEINEAYDKLKYSTLDTIYRLSRAAEYKDDMTGSHILRVSRYVGLICDALGLKERECEIIKIAASMHDVGKIGVPDEILLKPDKLDTDEWEIMKKHTIIGVEILGGSNNELLKKAEIIALTHHERWDGKGYPHGLSRQAIPIEGRIVAVADVFDALISERPYKKAYDIDKSFTIIKQSSGFHFDPAVVAAFFKVEKKIVDIKEQFIDAGECSLYKLIKQISSKN